MIERAWKSTSLTHCDTLTRNARVNDRPCFSVLPGPRHFMFGFCRIEVGLAPWGLPGWIFLILICLTIDWHDYSWYAYTHIMMYVYIDHICFPSPSGYRKHGWLNMTLFDLAATKTLAQDELKSLLAFRQCWKAFSWFGTFQLFQPAKISMM